MAESNRTIYDAETGFIFDVPATGEVIVGLVPANGRDIRLTSQGKFIVQPPNDNYWLEFDTYSAAVDAVTPDADHDEDAPPTFDALVSYWNGACYADGERCTLDAETEDDAIAEVRAMTFGDGGDYDLEVTIVDQDGNEVHTEHFEFSAAKSQQEEMEESWANQGEFHTDHCGVKDGQWYTWRTNGGSRGAHDRMDGSGRWIERYDQPKEIEPSEALDWLVEHTGMNSEEALDAMEAVDTAHTMADLVKEIGECLWEEDKWVGVYRVRENLYTVDLRDVFLVDDEQAVEFVADHDEDAVEKFEELL